MNNSSEKAIADENGWFDDMTRIKKELEDKKQVLINSLQQHFTSTTYEKEFTISICAYSGANNRIYTRWDRLFIYGTYLY